MVENVMGFSSVFIFNFSVGTKYVLDVVVVVVVVDAVDEGHARMALADIAVRFPALAYSYASPPPRA